MPKIETIEPINPELDALAAAAVAADLDANTTPAAASQPTNAAPVALGPDYQMEARGMVGMFAALVVGYCKEAESIWSEETQHRVASALAPTLEYFGFTVGNMPPWVMTLVIAGPPLYETARLVRTKMDAEKKETPAAEAMPTDAGASLDTPEQKVHPQMALYKNGRG